MPTTMTRDAAGNVWETKTKSSSKVEVRIRYCCCCSLRWAAVLIGIYTLLLYIVFLGLASNAVSRIISGTPDPAPYSPTATFRPNENTVVVVDPYFDSLGLYTEEMKYGPGLRYPLLIVYIVLFILIIIASILIFVAVFTELPWLVIPWIGLMILDIIRGIISVIMIFVYSGGDIRKIAVGIFFLGLQLFHISLVLIMIAFFQYLHAKIRGKAFPSDQTDRKSVIVEGSTMYPTMPANYGYSNYAYSTSPHIKRDPGSYPPSGYATQPPPAAARSRPESPSRYSTGPGYREFSTHSSRHGYQTT